MQLSLWTLVSRAFDAADWVIIRPRCQGQHARGVVSFPYAPRTGGAYDSHHRTAGVPGRTRRRGSTSGKWLELLKEIAPRVTRAAIIRDPTLTAAVAQFAAIQSAAASLGVELSPIDMRNTGEVERTIAAFARPPTAA